eukprot:m.415953 g.415953  ORF g.415953 m.415953 type:complete len:238 (-) comp29770_c0_seq1:220-933(-)
MSGVGGEGSSQLENLATEFASYEDFLNSQIAPIDLYYLEDEELARQLVELGLRGSGEVVKREEFDAKKVALEEARSIKREPPKKLLSEDLDLEKHPFLKALAEREEANRDGKMTTIIFIREKNQKGQEVSGYIDYAHRLKTDKTMEAVFMGKRRFMPQPTDLSFFNWETQQSKAASSPNYEVKTDTLPGIIFKNKRDRKLINPDPKMEPGDNTTRTMMRNCGYLHVVLYDHVTRRKA